MNIPRLKSFVKRRIQYIFTLSDLLFLRCGFILTANELKKTAAELEDDIAAHIERAAHGWTPVCGFISPGEREFERRLKALPYSRWIKTVPYGLPLRYDPSVEDSQWLASHRQLVLSSFDRAEYPPFVITRKGCLVMNDRIAQMVAACDRGLSPTTDGELPSPRHAVPPGPFQLSPTSDGDVHVPPVKTA